VVICLRHGEGMSSQRTEFAADWTLDPSAAGPVLRNIALVGHDHMKVDLADWAFHNRALLSHHRIYATGTTGRILRDRLGMPVHLFLSGPIGGDQQIGAAIAEGRIDALIFFWDPLEPQPHDPDVKALLRIATLWNIPVASNRTTADLIVTSPLFTGAYTPVTPVFRRDDETAWLAAR
jgi:methylglyoxal synthase